MLGIAYQKGLLPLEAENIEWAIKMSVKPEDLKEDMQAFNLGRKVAIHPREYSQDPRFDTYQEILRENEEILKRRRWGGVKLSKAYRELVEETVALLKLDDASHKQLAVRVYDLIQYENLAYAQKYVGKIREIYWKDSKIYGFEAVKAVIWNLHRVMVIKDEVYVSYLLTSEEKLKRDRERYQIDPENGDRVIYRHLNRPCFTVFGCNIEFDLVTRNWQLEIMKRAKFLRRILPDWHRREKEFRDWYVNLVDNFTYQDQESYQAYILSLGYPEMAKGYREIRYPKMAEARKFVDLLLHSDGQQKRRGITREGHSVPEPRWEHHE
jgi:indolepyruvate ferredoxin oxidoreductase